MQVDLSSIATPVETKKRVYKKRKVEEEPRPVEGGKSIKSLPPKEKKPPTEKQLAAREKLKQARLDKIVKVKEQKEQLDEQIRLKALEVENKKAELAEKRRLKREEKKVLMPQLPIKTSEPGRSGDVDPPKPTIAEALSKIGTVNVEEAVEEEPRPVEVLESTNFVHHLVTPKKVDKEFHSEAPQEKSRNVPDAPKREYYQRFRTYPFGKSIPAPPRFR